MMNRNSKYLKSLTPRLTTIVMPASYCILSVGQGMRALMKKLPGSLLPSLDMPLKLLQISTLHIQPSLVLFQVFDSGALHFNLKSYLKFKKFYKSNQFLLLLFYSLIVESSSSSPAPKPPSKLWAILFKYPFCSLRSSLIPTKAEKTSCFQPPVPLPSDSASNSTCTRLFFLGHDPSPPDLSCHFWLETRMPAMVQTIFW